MKDEALKLALEALEFFKGISLSMNEIERAEQAITAIKQALAAPAQPAPVQEPVAKHRDLHSHMMVVADRAVDKASNNGRESISQKEVVRAICKAIQTNKNLLAKLTPPAAQRKPQYNKTEMNCFVQNLYDEKMREGKHGHYEAMFHVVHRAIEAAHGIKENT
jgi:hypothetical protein